MTAPNGDVVTWKAIAELYPEFVQWVVQRHGPLHANTVLEAEYNARKMEYEHRADKT